MSKINDIIHFLKLENKEVEFTNDLNPEDIYFVYSGFNDYHYISFFSEEGVKEYLIDRADSNDPSYFSIYRLSDFKMIKYEFSVTLKT